MNDFHSFGCSGPSSYRCCWILPASTNIGGNRYIHFIHRMLSKFSSIFSSTSSPLLLLSRIKRPNCQIWCCRWCCHPVAKSESQSSWPSPSCARRTCRSSCASSSSCASCSSCFSHYSTAYCKYSCCCCCWTRILALSWCVDSPFVHIWPSSLRSWKPLVASLPSASPFSYFDFRTAASFQC